MVRTCEEEKGEGKEEEEWEGGEEDEGYAEFGRRGSKRRRGRGRKIQSSESTRRITRR